MEVTSWLDLCYRALGVPADVPEQERRRLAEHALLETTGQPVDILGIGAAPAPSTYLFLMSPTPLVPGQPV
jgi:hypothetical protein